MIFEWQQNKLRRAFRLLAAQHKNYTVVNDDLPIERFGNPWEFLVLDIKRVTGVDVGDPDTLRKFAEGTPHRKIRGVRSFPNPGPVKLSAFADYLTDNDTHLCPLSRWELEDFAPRLPFPIHLLEYYSQETMLPDRAIDISQFTGQYTAKLKRERFFVKYELTIEKPFSDGGALATVSEEIYVSEGEPTLFAMPDGANFHKGWLILSPEDNAEILLKDRKAASNWKFVNLAFEDDTFGLQPASKLYGIEIRAPMSSDQLKNTEEDCCEMPARVFIRDEFAK